MPFRDVWIVAASGGPPRRVTDMARSFPEPEPPAGTSLTDLMAKAAARSRGGVSEIIWAPDGQSLLLGYRGDIFRVGADGQGLTRVQQGGGRKSSLAFSPDGRFLSFLQGGDLWLWDQARELSGAGDAGRGAHHQYRPERRAVLAFRTSSSASIGGRPTAVASRWSISIAATCERSRCLTTSATRRA